MPSVTSRNIVILLTVHELQSLLYAIFVMMYKVENDLKLGCMKFMSSLSVRLAILSKECFAKNLCLMTPFYDKADIL